MPWTLLKLTTLKRLVAAVNVIDLAAVNVIDLAAMNVIDPAAVNAIDAEAHLSNNSNAPNPIISIRELIYIF